MSLGEGGIVCGTGSDGKGIYRGLEGISGRDCSKAKRSGAKRSGLSEAERSVVEQSGV